MTATRPSHSWVTNGALRWLRFSHAASTDYHKVLAPTDELAGRQRSEPAAIDGLRVEQPVERGQRLQFPELGLPYPPRDAPFTTLPRLSGDHPPQELQMRQPLPLGLRQDLIKLRLGQRNFQRCEVRQDLCSQILRRDILRPDRGRVWRRRRCRYRLCRTGRARRCGRLLRTGRCRRTGSWCRGTDRFGWFRLAFAHGA